MSEHAIVCPICKSEEGQKDLGNLCHECSRETLRLLAKLFGEKYE